LIDACSDNQQGGHASVNQNGESSDNQKYLAPGTNQDDHFPANRPPRLILIAAAVSPRLTRHSGAIEGPGASIA